MKRSAGASQLMQTRGNANECVVLLNADVFKRTCRVLLLLDSFLNHWADGADPVVLVTHT